MNAVLDHAPPAVMFGIFWFEAVFLLRPGVFS